MMHHAWSGPKHVATRRVPRSRQIAAAIAIGLALVVSLAFATPAQAAPSSVVVRNHDTLWALAAKYCGNPYAWTKLAAGNGITNVHRLRIGQTIRLTCAATTTGNSASRGTTRTTAIPAGGWVSPLASYRLTSCYGMRWGSLHAGLDLAAPGGTPIRSVAAGVVVRTGWIGSGYGLEVIVRHADGWFSHYAHQSRVAVRAGQSVAAGQTIGYVGHTGDATGDHLHFELARVATIFGRQQNPALVLRAHGVKIGC